MGSVFYGQAQAIATNGQIRAKQITTESGNKLRAAKNNLALFSQALGNRKIMEAAGKNVNAYGENIAHSIENATFGSFESQIQYSEALGSATALASAAGVGGSSVEAYNDTISTQYSMQKEQADRQVTRSLYQMGQQRGDQITYAVDSFDQNVYRADLDVSTYQLQKVPSFMSQALTLGAAAAATYFGGPQAGQAVLSFRDAQQQASNGNYVGAASSIDGALKSAVGAVKDYHDIGGSVFRSSNGTKVTNSGGSGLFTTYNAPNTDYSNINLMSGYNPYSGIHF